MAEDTEVAEVPAEIIAEAREAGWRPEDQFKGDKAKWVDAKTYLERAEHVLPIIKKDRDKLRAELASQATKVLTLEGRMKEASESLEGFKKYHEEDVKRRVKQARAELKKQLVQAKKDGDVEAEVQITEDLAELKDPPPVEKKKEEAAPGVDPAWKAILDEWVVDGNQWYVTDPVKSAYATSIAAFVHQTRRDLTGRDFLDEVAKQVQDKFPDKNQHRREAPDKVEGARPGSRQSNGGNAYADLPADAKAACDRDAEKYKLVGPNKAYKTAKDWQAQYAKDYFSMD